MNIEQFIAKNLNYAVVGASRDPRKYGQIVFNNLLNGGYKVYPINPNASEVSSQRCYPSIDSCQNALLAMGGGLDVVIFVVPPAVTLALLPELKALGVKTAWMQPGSESDAVVDYCRQNGIAAVTDCIMTQRARLGR